MSSRRSFLMTLASGAGAAAIARPLRLAAADGSVAGKLGLQLYSLRADLPKDLAGTLARVRELGIVEVETYGIPNVTPQALRAAMDAAGLKCQAAHVGLDGLDKDLDGVLGACATLGAHWVVCPWIPHEPPFDLEDAKRAADIFEKAVPAAKKQKMQIVYHCHGYEFLPSADGTTFDTLAKAAPNLSFEIDVFWAKAGGADPATLIAAYPGRMPLLHVKDMEKGLELPPGSSGAPHEKQVPVGTGQMDWPAILRAAEKAGGAMYYLEDESPSVWEQLPKSLDYLRNLTL